MLSGRKTVWNRVVLALLACWCSLAPVSAANPAHIATGTHWADPADFPTLRNLGYSFVILTLPPDEVTVWEETFAAAERNGLQLIAGLYPEPYQHINGKWTITPTGQTFLKFLASRAHLVKGVFVYNEPYWINPLTGRTSACGAASAADLRSLRNVIRSVWPAARIYHDIGHPSLWAPGGSLHASYACIGDKYADATGVADLVGLWHYPFERNTYSRDEGLRTLRAEIEYTRARMGAEPIVLGQSFSCESCGLPFWPRADDLLDWNCALRTLAPAAISWYVWKQSDAYSDYLSRHPESWLLTTPKACEATPVQKSPRVKAAVNGATFQAELAGYAPGTIVSVFGENLSEGTVTAETIPLPRTLGSTVVTVNGTAAPLFFVSPVQINLQLPFELQGNVAEVVVWLDQSQSLPLILPLAGASPGVFQAAALGRQQALVFHADGRLVSEQHPAGTGDRVILYGTGFGRVRPRVPSGVASPGAPGLARLVASPTVRMDGVDCTVEFAGLAPGYVGLYQLNLVVPQSTRITQPAIEVRLE
jgi:uncharacterized protein (TIGR03437 family)